MASAGALFLAWFVFPTMLTLIASRLSGTRPSMLHNVAAVVAHATVAMQAAGFLWILRLWLSAAWTACVGGLLLSAYTAYLGLDFALFAACRMRMQWQLLPLASALRGFAAHLPWRALMGGCALCASGAFVAGYRAATYAQAWLARPEGGVALLEATWLFVLYAALTQYGPARRALLWDNYPMAQQRISLQRAIRWLRRRPATPHAAQAAFAFALPPDEQGDMLDPAYPLLRYTRGFRGAKAFRVRMRPHAKPHVVVLFLESFRGADVGVLGAPAGITPNFDRLSREGVLWRNFYANGNTTSRAMVAAFYGVLPPLAQGSTQSMKRPPTLVGMPQLFTQAGYRTAFFGDGPADWENKRDFYLGQGFEAFYSAQSIHLAYPHLPRRGAWHFQDEYLMRFHADWLAAQQRHRLATFSSMLTITNHMPWYAAKHYPEPEVDLPRDSDRFRFLRTMMYTDHCLGLYVDLLRARGLDKNTVLLVLGDHGQQFDPTDHGIRFAGAYRDSHLRVPLLLIAPGQVDPAVIDAVGSQVDLLPTVMDMMGFSGVQHGIGASLLRARDDRAAVTHHPMAPAFSSMRFRHVRQTVLLDQGISEMYDLHTDPHEQNDLAMAAQEKAREFCVHAQALGALTDDLHAKAAFAPAALHAPWRVNATHLGMPADFPRTNAACNARMRALEDRSSRGAATPLEALEHAMLVHAATLQRDSATRLTLCQHIFHHTHRETMGDMPKAQEAAMQALERAACAARTTKAC